MKPITNILRALRARIFGSRQKPGTSTAREDPLPQEDTCMGVCTLCGGSCARHIHAGEHRCSLHAWTVGYQ